MDMSLPFWIFGLNLAFLNQACDAQCAGSVEVCSTLYSGWYFWVLLLVVLSCCCGGVVTCLRRYRRHQERQTTVDATQDPRFNISIEQQITTYPQVYTGDDTTTSAGQGGATMLSVFTIMSPPDYQTVAGLDKDCKPPSYEEATTSSWQ